MNDCFAIIGYENVELHNMILKLTQKAGHAIGFNEVEITNNPDFKNSLIIYDISKAQAKDIVTRLNKSSFIWKDDEQFCLFDCSGNAIAELQEEETDELLFEGTVTYPVLIKDKGKKEPTVKEFKFYKSSSLKA